MDGFFAFIFASAVFVMFLSNVYTLAREWRELQREER